MAIDIARRKFIVAVGGTAFAWPLAARAQQPALPVVGFLSGRSLATDANLVAAFKEGLKETGQVEGQTMAIDFRWAEGRFDRLPILAADLAARHVSVIFTGGADVQIRAIKNAIATTSAVFAVGGDPVQFGLVASMNRPGGNVTAVTVLTAELWPKRLELARDLVPSAALIALLVDPDNPTAADIMTDVQSAAKLLGVQTSIVKARNEQEMDDVFTTLTQQRAGALLVTADPLFIGRRPQLISLAKRYAVPTIYDRRDFPANVGLMSYGASAVDQYRQSGRYVGRILNGDKPADLPVLQPTKFELVINSSTAKALGLKVPDKLLALADEVIE